eukprot:3350305-Rhodomonas_salina.1
MCEGSVAQSTLLVMNRSLRVQDCRHANVSVPDIACRARWPLCGANLNVRGKPFVDSCSNHRCGLRVSSGQNVEATADSVDSLDAAKTIAAPSHQNRPWMRLC